MNGVNNLKIGFFGTSDFALKALTNLFNKSFDIKYVVSQSPKPSGRGQRLAQSPVHRFAKKKHLNIFTPANIDNLEFINKIRNYKVDFIVIVAYGKIVNENILKLPKFYCLNIHASILPKWRGAAPIQRAILNGDNETGVSIIVVEPKLDSGPIVLSQTIRINKNDNAGFLHHELSVIGSELVILAIKKISENKYNLKKQEESKSTYAKKISKDETKIVWSQNVELIHAKIRAFAPWPGAWTFWKKNNEKIRMKILDSEIIEKYDDMPQLINGQSDGKLVIKCNDKYLKLKKLQIEGKKIITSNEFANGFRLNDYLFE